MKKAIAQTDSVPLVPRRRQPTRRPTRFLVLLVAVVLVGNAIVGERGLIAMMRAGDELDTLTEMIALLRAENDGLRQDVRRLREEVRTIEALARGELGLIRPGEKLFIVTESTPPAAPVPAPPRQRRRTVVVEPPLADESSHP